MHALVSIHDVMPETLDSVRALIDLLPPPCHKDLTLLVVPGRDWQPAQIDQLARWQQQGYHLAGHGWHHTIRGYGGLYHRLHALFVSRTAGEHLALSEREIIDLMLRNHAWFVAHGLSSPDYYVPPAWALGIMDFVKLRQTPFRYLEITSGIVDVGTGELHRLPLCGFEADTGFRAAFLRLWNGLQAGLGSSTRPVRISLHPNDPSLKVADQMHRLLGEVTEARDYHSVFATT